MMMKINFKKRNRFFFFFLKCIQNNNWLIYFYGAFNDFITFSMFIAQWNKIVINPYEKAAWLFYIWYKNSFSATITDNISHTRSSMTWCRRNLLILVLKRFFVTQRALTQNKLVVIASSFVIFVSILLLFVESKICNELNTPFLILKL